MALSAPRPSPQPWDPGGGGKGSGSQAGSGCAHTLPGGEECTLARRGPEEAGPAAHTQLTHHARTHACTPGGVHGDASTMTRGTSEAQGNWDPQQPSPRGVRVTKQRPRAEQGGGGGGGRRRGALLSSCCRQTWGWCGPVPGSHLCRARAQLHTARLSGEDLQPVWRGSSGRRARQPGSAHTATGGWSGKWASGSGAHIRGLAGHRGRGGSSPPWPQGPAGTAQGQE